MWEWLCLTSTSPSTNKGYRGIWAISVMIKYLAQLKPSHSLNKHKHSHCFRALLLLMMGRGGLQEEEKKEKEEKKKEGSFRVSLS